MFMNATPNHTPNKCPKQNPKKRARHSCLRIIRILRRRTKNESTHTRPNQSPPNRPVVARPLAAHFADLVAGDNEQPAAAPFARKS